jgi:hypothetical protein
LLYLGMPIWNQNLELGGTFEDEHEALLGLWGRQSAGASCVRKRRDETCWRRGTVTSIPGRCTFVPHHLSPPDLFSNTPSGESSHQRNFIHHGPCPAKSNYREAELIKRKVAHNAFCSPATSNHEIDRQQIKGCILIKMTKPGHNRSEIKMKTEPKKRENHIKSKNIWEDGTGDKHRIHRKDETWGIEEIEGINEKRGCVSMKIHSFYVHYTVSVIFPSRHIRWPITYEKFMAYVILLISYTYSVVGM